MITHKMLHVIWEDGEGHTRQSMGWEVARDGDELTLAADLEDATDTERVALATTIIPINNIHEECPLIKVEVKV